MIARDNHYFFYCNYPRILITGPAKQLIMGGNESQITQQGQSSIQDIYSMFKQSNSIMIHALQSKNPALTRPRIKNVQNILQQLLEPFKPSVKYVWGEQICTKFVKYFTQDFQMLWIASRQHFYQQLLYNCKISGQGLDDEYKKCGTFQSCFFKIAGEQPEWGMEDSLCVENQHNFMLTIHNLTIIGEETKKESLTNSRFNSFKEAKMSLYIQQERQYQSFQSKQVRHVRRFKMETGSLLLPQSLYSNRLGTKKMSLFADRLMFYKQFAVSLQQTFFSNNLVSCPMKNFISYFEEKLTRLNAIMEKVRSKQSQIDSSQDGRRFYKTREKKNNELLAEIKYFINAYTEFVWMFFQLHLMKKFYLTKLTNSQILYGIIFKHMWGFVDEIVNSGYQLEQAQLQTLTKYETVAQHSIITLELMERYIFLIDQLRNERHPQQYLRKVVVFYQQVSKNCRNADELLGLLEEVMILAIKRKGSKNLALFRMKNIIQKFLIQGSTLNTGQIAYSWTNWCILIEILWYKSSLKYEDVFMFKKQEGDVISSGTKTNTKEQKLVQERCLPSE